MFNKFIICGIKPDEMYRTSRQLIIFMHFVWNNPIYLSLLWYSIQTQSFSCYYLIHLFSITGILDELHINFKFTVNEPNFNRVIALGLTKFFIFLLDWNMYLYLYWWIINQVWIWVFMKPIWHWFENYTFNLNWSKGFIYYSPVRGFFPAFLNMFDFFTCTTVPMSMKLDTKHF